jgi:hypothetical protein
VHDPDGNKLADLGLSCLYTGGMNGYTLPPLSIPEGGESVLEVASVDGLAIVLTASDGTGPTNCTKGSGPGKHCINGSTGTDGNGTCTTDADCGTPAGSCDEDANCFFGPPIPVNAGFLSACALNVIRHDLCGTADLAANTTTMSAGLAPRLYVTGNPTSPCPQCLGGLCDGGKRAGLPCGGVVNASNTTIDCPPSDFQFAGRLELVIPQLGTGTSTLEDPDGKFCPNQRTPGAFGLPDLAGAITETGIPLASGGGMIFDTALAGTFCIPKSGNLTIDVNADLPGPGALSAAGSLSVCLLPDVCNTLCNPCTLGPLCDVLCSPCLLCLP